MATYTGASIVDGALAAASADPLGQHFDEVRAAPAFTTTEAVSGPLSGAQTENRPITQRAATKTGATPSPGFMADYYNRIHVTPLTIDCGNVITAQQQTIYVWNAYFEPRSLVDIAETGTDGISITKPIADPGTFAPLEAVTYTLSVTTDGPATIAASYAFEFDTETVDVAVTGSRITAWTWAPDGEVLERLEWLTDVITAYDGTEQRAQIRGTPRRWFEHAITLTDAERRKAEVTLYGWGARLWGLPVWMDGSNLGAPVTAGDSTITVDTSDLDYIAGGMAIIMTDSDTYEIVEIDTVGANSLTLSSVALQSWTTSARIYPLRTARLPDTVQLRRFTGGVSYGRLRWQCQDVSDYTPATEATTHQGYPVLTSKPNWIEDIESDVLRKLAWLDTRSGQITVDDEAGIPFYLHSHRWLLDGRDEITDFRKWLYARKGRLTAFWLPTWSEDMVLTATVGALSPNIDIEHINYTKQATQGIGRRDIRIELVNGSVYYRRIEGSVEVDSSTERLTLDSALGVEVAPGDVRMISFMALGRLDADAAEIRWWTWDVAEAALNVRTIGNDI